MPITDFALVTSEPVPLFKVIIGVCAYNEESNIGHLLPGLLSKHNLPEKHKILIICSGCTDRTPVHPQFLFSRGTAQAQRIENAISEKT